LIPNKLAKDLALDLIGFYSPKISTNKKNIYKRNKRRKKEEKQLKEETWNFSNFMKGLQNNINLQNIGDGIGACC